MRGLGLALALSVAGAAPIAGQEHAAHEHGKHAGPAIEHHASDAIADPPFSEAVRVGHMLFLSGMIGTDPETRRLVPGGIGPETRQTMENIRSAVERHGSSMDRVVKCTVMLADIAEWGAMNEVYVTFFPGPKPARSAFGSSGLALDARVEVECLAVLPSDGRQGG